MHRNAPRNSPRRAKTVRNTLACAAVALPVLLVAGCSSDSDSGKEADSSASSSSEAAPSAVPAKFKSLPDSCKSLSKDTVKDLVPKSSDSSGKRVGSGNTNDSNSCLWSGLDKYDYRQLTVSLKRFESDTSLGSGDKRAGKYLKQQAEEVSGNKDNKKAMESNVGGVGSQATAITYEAKKKDSKGKAEDFRAERLVARSANAVITVDYEGTGFEGGKLPSSDELKKKAEKAAKEALSHLK